MLNPFSLKRAAIDDLLEIQSISRRTFYNTFAAFNTEADMQHYLEHDLSLEQLHREMQDPQTEFYLAFSEGTTSIGFLKLHHGVPQTAPFAGSALEIARIYIDVPYFGSSLAPQMMQLAYDRADERHCRYVWLGVWEHNPRAIRFYEKQGFRAFGTHDFILGSDRQTDILMALPRTSI